MRASAEESDVVRAEGSTNTLSAHAVSGRTVSLCEALDRLLHKGAFVGGDLVISIADVDLVYVGLSLVAASVDTIREWNEENALRRHSSEQ
jgi:hypothetical protein